MESVKCLNDGRARPTKTVRLQGRARFFVKALTSQADGHRSPQLWRRGLPTNLSRGRPRVPQAEALTALPPLQPVQGEGGRCLLVSPPSARRGTKEALREHEELTPGPFIVGVSDLRQRPGEHLTPTVSSCSRDMSEDWRLRRLDGGQAGQIRGIIHVHGLVRCCITGFRSAGGMHTTRSRDG